MTKFQLGDMVTYTNKRDFGDRVLKGPIIQIIKYGRDVDYMIAAEEYGVYKYSLGTPLGVIPYPLRRHSVTTISSPDEQVDFSYFAPSTTGGLRRAMIPTYSVGSRSKNLRPAMKPYDPAQQPWTEDDI